MPQQLSQLSPHQLQQLTPQQRQYIAQQLQQVTQRHTVASGQLLFHIPCQRRILDLRDNHTGTSIYMLHSCTWRSANLFAKRA